VTATSLIGFAFVLGLAIALFSFALGRRVGFHQGRKTALREAPLRLKVDALNSGVCPVCNTHR